MDEAKCRAYRILLAQCLLHLKWELAGFYRGLSFLRPWQLIQQSRYLRVAAHRASAFHNLAIFASADFTNFSEEQFWTGIDRFHRDFPHAIGSYREVFDRCLRGEPINIVIVGGRVVPPVPLP